MLRERRGDLGARRVPAGDADRLADELASALEDAVGALADVLDSHAREPLVAHRIRDREHAVLAALWAEAEEDEVLPVERRVVEGRRNARVAEEGVRVCLRVE